ncbi:unnamed protein product [Prorocentrum cordatum]|nr:unnamed protein product [Polarella glacialis]
MVSDESVVCASQATQALAISIFLYEGFAYNVVFLMRILPALGKQACTVAFAVVFNAFWGLALWAYFAAHAADPGTLPERWREFVNEVGDALPIAPSRPEWQPGKATFCKKCNLPRPERAHHCVICGVCVLRMDHHCPWINNCVGFYNHIFSAPVPIRLRGERRGRDHRAAAAQLLCQRAGSPGGPGGFGEPCTFRQIRRVHISEEETVLEETATVRAAQERCATLRDCAGFTFEGVDSLSDAEAEHLVFYKAKWNLLGEGHGWTSYRMEQGRLDTTDVVLFLLFGALAALVGMLLAPTLATHLPFAVQNVTSIEDNYENMPNPFDQGGVPANLAQVFGAYGPDWLLPIPPRRPLSDGVSFPRSDERLMPDGLPERAAPGDEDEANERLWRLRYRVRSPTTAMAERGETGPLMSSPWSRVFSWTSS